MPRDARLVNKTITQGSFNSESQDIVTFREEERGYDWDGAYSKASKFNFLTWVVVTMIFT